MRTLLLLSVSMLCASAARTQCNGLTESCLRPYDEVAYLTTHNAFNVGSEGYAFPNQNNAIDQQLTDGVRGFMLDVYDFFGTPTLYHGSIVLGSEPLSNALNSFKSFLDNNPNEVVTIILECYVSANDIEDEINGAGLDGYLYTKDPFANWSTLQEMIDANTRLVIFSDVDDASASQEWYHYMWDHATETHFSVGDPNDFTNEFNRGDSLNDLFIFNHFVTDPILGIGQEAASTIVNDSLFLMTRIVNNYQETEKFPNFVTLDFYELGDGKAIVDHLNGGHLDVKELQSDWLSIFPNPAEDYILVRSPIYPTEIKVLDMKGKTVIDGIVLTSETDKINLSELNSGIYYLQVQHADHSNHIRKLIVQ